MTYRKFVAAAWLGRTMELRSQRFSFVCRRIGGEDAALESIGRKAAVYKLQQPSGGCYALKVFHKRFASEVNSVSTRFLRVYAGMAGLRVCNREVLMAGDAEALNEPALEWAILMPWIEGKAWAEIIADRDALPEPQCIALAQAAAGTLSGLEKIGLTHADISSSNVFVQPGTPSAIELIDVEDMHHSSFVAPNQAPAGTPGYNHSPSAGRGYWNPYGDRFAGAVILSEMLTWHSADIRAKADEFSYFHRDEMCIARSDKYEIMLRALEGHSNVLADLFRTAWNSSRLEDCPSLSDWSNALRKVKPASRKPASAVWLPGIMPRFDLGAAAKKPLAFETQLLSRFMCYECGRIIGNNLKDHEVSCSHHPSNIQAALDLTTPALSSKAIPPLWWPKKAGVPQKSGGLMGHVPAFHAPESKPPALDWAASAEPVAPKKRGAPKKPGGLSGWIPEFHAPESNPPALDSAASAEPVAPKKRGAPKKPGGLSGWEPDFHAPESKPPARGAPTEAIAPKKPGALSRYLTEFQAPESKPPALDWGALLPIAPKKPRSLSAYLANIPAADPDPPAAPNKCAECGKELTRPDARDHSLFCTKHPDYRRTRPSRFNNVRFMPLTASEQENKPLSGLFSGLSHSAFGDYCSHCKRWVLRGAAHDPLCPNARG